ncbi:hypothetical protein ASE67_15405 [Sphingomonas sp. Leaf23]|uniref:DUF5691 domain-containing protein n=1 Tax=Sphingomonas sp. Leaf23 TaxID=1735689 RepID=UPI0006FEEEB7|nr:DUF5691 domain-containing protein [Sphingomonas sp. Leaf23]KQM85061.1 hypothetical protein ASE67_15405 [Sphingomonas sp. Leaf23]
MADAILHNLTPVLTRWTMGGSAVRHAPPAWRDTLGDAPEEAELRLLALSGQFVGTQVIAEPAGAVQPAGDIPVLARPPLPELFRPSARRLLRSVRAPDTRRHLLDFLDRRGWTLHPGDWMPRADDDVPPVYAPWQDWAAMAATSTDAAELTDETWDDFGPAARLAALIDLRGHDPAAASALLLQRIAGEPADHRMRLLQTLVPGLSDADRPLLDLLASADRAPRVRALATAYIEGLDGRTSDREEEDAATLAAFFAVQTRGLLRRTRILEPLPPENIVYRNRRTDLFGAVPVDGFARALKLAAIDLVAIWPWGSDALLDRGFTQMLARSGTAPVVAAAADTLTLAKTIDRDVLGMLLPRLTPAQRQQAAERLIRANGATFDMVRAIAGGDGAIDDAIHMPAGIALLNALAAGDAGPGDHAGELLALGLVASRPAAAQALDRLVAVGMIASDPRLDMLRLNAALDHRRPTE